MRTVFSIAIELREKLGCVGVVVDAKPGAENYYFRYGFVDLQNPAPEIPVRGDSAVVAGPVPDQRERQERPDGQAGHRSRCGPGGRGESQR